MDDKTLTTILTGMAQVPAYIFLLWIWVKQMASHQAAIDYHRKRIEELEARLIECYKAAQKENGP